VRETEKEQDSGVRANPRRNTEKTIQINRMEEKRSEGEEKEGRTHP
jgi:hypothetical protein